MWNVYIGRNVELCQKHWWRNLLYIQNLFGMEKMVTKRLLILSTDGSVTVEFKYCSQCLLYTHHLAIDFQLFVMAVPLMYLLKKSKAVALFLIAAIMSASTVIRYLVAKNSSLSTVLYFGSE